MIPEIIQDSVQSASEAGLRYVSDAKPGISRRRAGRGFFYTAPDGSPVKDKPTLKRIRSLVIPPNWNNVWICPIPNGHLQATGRDAKGRKQYRYHARYRSAREENKFSRMEAFGEALPKIRKRVKRDLALPGLPRDKVLATIVRLLDLTRIRVGNEEYAKQNESFGLTTMRDDHVEVRGSKLRFTFRGKSGKLHSVELDHPRLARIVKQCRDLPGWELFQYVDDDGATVVVDSAMVNCYLREISGENITAKDFRTWHGSVQAAVRLGACGAAGQEKEIKHNVVEVVKTVAEVLGNRPATCRKYYIHPAVLDAYGSGALVDLICPTQEDEAAEDTGLTRQERCVLELFRKHSFAGAQTEAA